MGVTATFFLQSIAEGNTVTFSYLKEEVFVEHSCTMNLFRVAMNSSFVRFANWLIPNLHGLFPAPLNDSIYAMFSLNILKRFSFS